jgi:hypothetical protein
MKTLSFFLPCAIKRLHENAYIGCCDFIIMKTLSSFAAAILLL